MFRYFKVVLLSGFRAIAAYFFKIKGYAKHPEKTTLEQKYNQIHKTLKHVVKNFDCDIHVVGEENILNEPAYYVCNHQSFLDPLVIIATMKTPLAVVGKAEVEKMPLIGNFLKALGGVFIVRDDLKQTFKEMLKVQEDLKEKNKSWLIFAEGTRNKDEKKKLLEMHHGSFRPATKTDTPIVPITIQGSYRVLKTKPWLKKYPIYIEFHKPIYAVDYKDMTTQEVAKKVQDTIEASLIFKARPYDHAQMLKINSKKYNIYK